MLINQWKRPLFAPEGAEGGSPEGASDKSGSATDKGASKTDDKGGKGKEAIKPSHDESTPADRGDVEKPAKGGKSTEKKVADRPEWAPENFWDAEKGELRVEELAKGFSETKKKLSMRTDDLTKTLKEDFEKERFAKRPESADKYELRAPKELADAWEFNDKDPLVQFARNLAYETGMGQDDFDKLVGTYIESEIAKLPDIQAETKRLGEKGAERIERVDQWLSANVSRGAYAVLSKYAVNADMVVAIEELMTKAGAPAYVLGDNGYGSQDILTDAQVKTWMADPKYWDPQQRDPAFVKKVDDAWRKLYPSKK